MTDAKDTKDTKTRGTRGKTTAGFRARRAADHRGQLPAVPQRGGAEGRADSRHARRHHDRRRKRHGARRRRCREEPPRADDPRSDRAEDAAEEHAAARGDCGLRGVDRRGREGLDGVAARPSDREDPRDRAGRRPAALGERGRIPSRRLRAGGARLSRGAPRDAQRRPGRRHRRRALPLAPLAGRGTHQG